MILWLILSMHISIGIKPLFLPSISGVRTANESVGYSSSWNTILRQQRLEQLDGILLEFKKRY